MKVRTKQKLEQNWISKIQTSEVYKLMEKGSDNMKPMAYFLPTKYPSTKEFKQAEKQHKEEFKRIVKDLLKKEGK